MTRTVPPYATDLTSKLIRYSADQYLSGGVFRFSPLTEQESNDLKLTNLLCFCKLAIAVNVYATVFLPLVIRLCVRTVLFRIKSAVQVTRAFPPSIVDDNFVFNRLKMDVGTRHCISCNLQTRCRATPKILLNSRMRPSAPSRHLSRVCLVCNCAPAPSVEATLPNNIQMVRVG